MNTAAANARLDEALQEIETAQRHLDAACRALCPIVGGVARWTRIMKLADRVRAERRELSLWCDVDRTLRVDHEAAP
jgi:hypothetical protein